MGQKQVGIETSDKHFVVMSEIRRKLELMERFGIDEDDENYAGYKEMLLMYKALVLRG